MNMITKLTALTTLAAAGSSLAAVPNQAVYADELARCVSELRPDISDNDTRQLRHYVTDVDTRGAWYEFAIRSEVFNEVEGPVIREARTTCRAHRWSTEIELQQT